jgi:glycosyltransferase involved in cell wall biosynthesis
VSRKLRILCINQFFYPDHAGGVERVTHETVHRLAARGHSVDLVGLRTRPGTPDSETIGDVRVHRYGGDAASRRLGGRSLDAVFRCRPVFAALAGEGRFDIVLSQHFFPYYAYLRAVRRKQVPEVMTFHASYWREHALEGAERSIGRPLEWAFGQFLRRTEVSCLKRADRVVLLSEFSREQVTTYYPFAERKIVKIPGGVDLGRFRPAEDRHAVRQALGLPVDRPVVFTARRLVPRMGLENLIEAVAQVKAVFPDVYLAVAGRGRLEVELRDRSRWLGLADDVALLGFVDDDDLVRYYQAADVFVLPSVAFEGFGLVTLEALACGTPVLGTPIGATPEILRPLAPQLVLAGPEPAAIRRGVQVLLEWLSDDDAAAALRARCRRYVEARYDWETAIDALEELLLELSRGGREG